MLTDRIDSKHHVVLLNDKLGCCARLAMSKRKLNAEDSFTEQFQALRQVKSLTHVQCRSVMTLLNADQERQGTRSCTKEHQLYPAAAPAARRVPLEVGGKRIEVNMFSIANVTQNKINACPLFRESLEVALKKNRNNLDLLLFWDEAVPGNALAPDLRRKSAMAYFTYVDLPILWADTAWMTLSVCRTQDLLQVPEGHTRSFSLMLEEIRHETEHGFMLELGDKAVLTHLRRIFILADADGLRLLTGSKGASGLKPCYRCKNIVSGDHIGLCNHEHISSTRMERWQQHSMESVVAIASFLENIPGKTAKEKAETQLGWKAAALNCSALLNPNLRDLLDLTHIFFDPMHCFVANGIVTQELGLWYTRLTTKTQVTLDRLRSYAQTCWQSCVPGMFDMTKIFASKLWVADRDYRGDASDTLSALPLCVAFCFEVVLPVFPTMLEEVKTLTALYAVILSWLRAKYGDATQEASLMKEKQKYHVSCFLQAYSATLVRPKLHYSLHLPEQFLIQKQAFDAFPGERKHIYFKSNVAPRCKCLGTLSRTALLELGEMDLKTNEKDRTLKTRLQEPIQLDNRLASAFRKGTWTVSKKLQHAAHTHAAGEYKLLPDGSAVEIICAAQGNNSYYLLCKELHKKKEIAHGFTCWTCEKKDDNLNLLPLEFLSQCDTAALKRVECKDTHKNIWLLLG